MTIPLVVNDAALAAIEQAFSNEHLSREVIHSTEYGVVVVVGEETFYIRVDVTKL